MSNEPLTSLPNIGNVLQEKLEGADIRTYGDLKKAGSIKALMQIQSEFHEGCFNMLYALEGAIRGVRWHDLPVELRNNLKEELKNKFGV